jgi:hypothetical protein
MVWIVFLVSIFLTLDLFVFPLLSSPSLRLLKWMSHDEESVNLANLDKASLPSSPRCVLLTIYNLGTSKEWWQQLLRHLLTSSSTSSTTASHSLSSYMSLMGVVVLPGTGCGNTNTINNKVTFLTCIKDFSSKKLSPSFFIFSFFPSSRNVLCVIVF